MRIGDKEYTPRYPIMACIALEEVSGKRSILDLVDDVRSVTPSVGMMVSIIWAGFIADNPKLTREDLLEELESAPGGQLRAAYVDSLAALYAAVSHLLFTDEAGAAEGTEKN